MDTYKVDIDGKTVSFDSDHVPTTADLTAIRDHIRAARPKPGPSPAIAGAALGAAAGTPKPDPYRYAGMPFSRMPPPESNWVAPALDAMSYPAGAVKAGLVKTGLMSRPDTAPGDSPYPGGPPGLKADQAEFDRLKGLPLGKLIEEARHQPFLSFGAPNVTAEANRRHAQAGPLGKTMATLLMQGTEAAVDPLSLNLVGGARAILGRSALKKAEAAANMQAAARKSARESAKESPLVKNLIKSAEMEANRKSKFESIPTRQPAMPEEGPTIAGFKSTRSGTAIAAEKKTLPNMEDAIDYMVKEGVPSVPIPKRKPVARPIAPAKNAKPIKPLWEMNDTELGTHYSNVKKSDDVRLEKILGGEAAVKRYNALQRTANNSLDMARADKAWAEIEKIEGGLSKTDREYLGGVGQPDHAVPEIVRDYQRALGALDYDTPEALANSIKHAITNVGEKTNPADMLPSEQLAYAQLRMAYEHAQKMGWDTKAISEKALEGAAGRWSDPADAAFMLRRFTQDPPVPTKPAIKAKRNLRRGSLDSETLAEAHEMFEEVGRDFDAWTRKVMDEFSPEAAKVIIAQAGKTLRPAARIATVQVAKQPVLDPNAPGTKVVEALKLEKRERRKTNLLYSEERGEKVAVLDAMRAKAQTWDQKLRARGAMSGELSKVVTVKTGLDPTEMKAFSDARIDTHPKWERRPLTKQNADEALDELFNPRRDKPLQDNQIKLLEEVLTKEEYDAIADHKVSWGQRIDAFRYANMLSNPKTWLVTNTVGDISNATLKTAEALMRNPTSAPVRIGGALRGMSEGAQEWLTIMKTGHLKGEASGIDFSDTGFRGGLANPFNVPGRTMRATDQFFYKMAYHSDLAAQARIAAKGDAALYSRLLDKPTDAIHGKATEFAREATFRLAEEGPTAEFMRRVFAPAKNARVFGPAVKAIMPFANIAAEITRQGVNRTPGLGALRLVTKAGRADIPKVLSEQASGSMLAITGYFAAQSGLVTGAAPKDKKEKAAFYASGKKPWSFRIPGTKRWIDLKYAGPAAFPFIIGAAVKDYTSGKGQIAPKQAGQIATSLGRFAIDQTNVRGANEFLEFLKAEGDTNKLPASITSQYIPLSGLQRGIAFATDDIIRDPDTYLEHLKVQTPGVSQQVKRLKNAKRTGGVIDALVLSSGKEK